MPIKDANKRLEYNKLWKRKQRQHNYAVDVLDVPDVPVDAYIYHSVRRFELFYDTIQMRDELSKQTNFNKWMSRQLNVVDEIKFIENENIKYHELKNPKLIIRQSRQFNITVIPLQDKDKYKIEIYKACCLGKIYLKFEKNLNVDNI